MQKQIWKGVHLWLKEEPIIIFDKLELNDVGVADDCNSKL